MTSEHDARHEPFDFGITFEGHHYASIQCRVCITDWPCLARRFDDLTSQLAASEAARARLVEAAEHVAEAARRLLWSAQGLYGNRWHAAADSEAGLEDAIGQLRALTVASGQGGAGEE